MDELDIKEAKIRIQISEIETHISKCKDAILSYEETKAKLKAILEEIRIAQTGKRVEELGDYNPISSVEQLVKVLNFYDKNSFCWTSGDPAINGFMLRLLEAHIRKGREVHILIDELGGLVYKVTKANKEIYPMI
jgi:hypothetical protein